MSETVSKKIKIYNLAKDLNLSHDTIIDFLKKRGFEVKGHMALVTDEMMQAVLSHFKKEKDVAERHQKKMTEFRQARKKDVPAAAPKTEKKSVKEAEPVPAPAAEELPPSPVEETEAEQLAPEPVVETEATAVEVPESVQEPTPVPAVSVSEPVQAPQAEQPAPAAAEVEQPPVKPAESVAEKHAEPAKPAQEPHHRHEDRHRKKKQEEQKREVRSPLEMVNALPKRGLTIKGKLDLDASGKVVTASGIESEDAKKKKKKKKKVREETKKPKTKETTTEEETPKTKKRRRSRHAEVDSGEVERAIRDTFAEMEDVVTASRASIRKKKRKEREEEAQAIQEQIERDKMVMRVTEFVTVGELANLMKASVAEVIQKCIGLGIMVSINQRLDKDTIVLVADEFGFQVDFEKEFAPDELVDAPDEDEELQPRAPVVTIMGHVDHGKTSLLDHIRSANVVAGEAGGITQHIGAYEVMLPSGKTITFLDTPGHEAFTAMRARGAQVTDIVVLVVAADDNVMPQTVEAISHAQAANVPIIIAINKVDKADANPERIRQQLSEKGVLVEEWGGKYQSVEISAKKGMNIDKLLEKILLEAEILDLKANPEREARGVIVESELDKGKGITATVLIQKGTMSVGDSFVCGVWSGRVRAMFDERGRRVESAGPSCPVQVTGFDGIPQAGDQIIVMEDERKARDISVRRQQLKREQDFRQQHMVTLDDISEQIKQGEIKDLPIIVKGDVDGSVEALSDSLLKLSTPEVKVRVIHKGVGGISETDVLLAAASRAIIIGFHVRPNLNARKLAGQENVEIRLYSIIYNAINEVRSALEGMLAPTVSEEIIGTAEIRDIFKISKVGTIAGCYILSGKIVRNNKVRLIRDAVVVFEGGLASLRRLKDDVREVESGFECGIGLDGYNDIKVGDIIESFTLVESKRKL